jgi:hypothetical protein
MSSKTQSPNYYCIKELNIESELRQNVFLLSTRQLAENVLHFRVG